MQDDIGQINEFSDFVENSLYQIIWSYDTITIKVKQKDENNTILD